MSESSSDPGSTYPFDDELSSCSGELQLGLYFEALYRLIRLAFFVNRIGCKRGRRPQPGHAELIYRGQVNVVATEVSV